MALEPARDLHPDYLAVLEEHLSEVENAISRSLWPGSFSTITREAGISLPVLKRAICFLEGEGVIFTSKGEKLLEDELWPVVVDYLVINGKSTPQIPEGWIEPEQSERAEAISFFGPQPFTVAGSGKKPNYFSPGQMAELSTTPATEGAVQRR